MGEEKKVSLSSARFSTWVSGKRQNNKEGEKKKRNVLTRATREYLEMSNSNRWLELGFL